MNQTTAMAIQAMRENGVEHTIPTTERVLLLRSLEPADLLRDGKMPDLLTPLVVRSVYEDVSDKAVVDYLEGVRTTKEEALAFLDSLDYIARKSIMDGTKVEDLILSEKRWIFRLVMGPAEFLATFRYEPPSNVELVDEGDEVLETA